MEKLLKRQTEILHCMLNQIIRQRDYMKIRLYEQVFRNELAKIKATIILHRAHLYYNFERLDYLFKSKEIQWSVVTKILYGNELF